MRARKWINSPIIFFYPRVPIWNACMSDLSFYPTIEVTAKLILAFAYCSKIASSRDTNSLPYISNLKKETHSIQRIQRNWNAGSVSIASSVFGVADLFIEEFGYHKQKRSVTINKSFLNPRDKREVLRYSGWETPFGFLKPRTIGESSQTDDNQLHFTFVHWSSAYRLLCVTAVESLLGDNKKLF